MRLLITNCNDKEYFLVMNPIYFIRRYYFFILACLSSQLFIGCQAQPDPSLANIFEPLDGTWKGIFTIYTDTTGQQPGNVQPRISDPSYLKQLPLKVTDQIEVVQVYVSESPFFQTVEITDTYTNSEGKLNKVKSNGYNQVKGKELVCIVNKPDEQVIHQGSSPEENIIIWERQVTNPLKVEYFYEKVEEETYSILGWGYYGDDQPELSPKTWFYAEYKKQ